MRRRPASGERPWPSRDSRSTHESRAGPEPLPRPEPVAGREPLPRREWLTPSGRPWSATAAAAGRLDRAGGGLTLDIALYGLAALFAWATAAGSTLPAHRAWGAVAALGYTAATVAAAGQRAARAAARRRGSGRLGFGRAGRAGVARVAGHRWRAGVAAAAWAAVALLPLVLFAGQRSAGRTGRAQEEVQVIEAAGQRLVATGTPYLDRSAIAVLAEPGRLLGYLPYQPGMALFGLPRAVDPGAAWWSDARVWFAVVTVGALAGALWLLCRAGASPDALVRCLQAATVFPVCALTLATGGDDLPVLALCLLALALAATGRPGWSGLAAGTAAALKLLAWPVALTLAAFALTQGRAAGARYPAGARYSAGALAIPVLTALPIFAADPAAMVENVLAFPLGRGLVASPARSPLPGYLIATALPAGRAVAIALVLLAGLAIGGALIRRPPASAAAAACYAGLGLLAAILLLPATRFGYLLYPVALLAWAPALRGERPGQRPTIVETAPADPG